MHTLNYFLEKLTHTLEKSEVLKTEVLPAVKKININEVLEKTIIYNYGYYSFIRKVISGYTPKYLKYSP